MNCSNGAVRGRTLSRPRLNNDSNDAKDDYAPTRHHALCHPARGCVSNSDDPREKLWSDVGRPTASSALPATGWPSTRPSAGTRWMSPSGEQGRQKGLAWYCRPEHLYLAGRSGRSIAVSSQRRAGPSPVRTGVATAGPINRARPALPCPQTPQKRGPIPPCSSAAAADTGSPYHWRSGHTLPHTNWVCAGSCAAP